MKMSKTVQSPDTYTHEDMRKHAVRWLSYHFRCSVVLSEMHTTATQEIPDAVGFKSSHSICVEAKISRADYLVNRRKTHCLIPEMGVGQRRFIIIPRDLISVDEHRERYPEYGLATVHENGVIRLRHESSIFETNKSAEVGMLVSALRRVKTREFLTINVIGEGE